MDLEIIISYIKTIRYSLVHLNQKNLILVLFYELMDNGHLVNGHSLLS